MDFLRYAECAAALVNADLADEHDVRRLLADRPRQAERVRARDVRDVRRLRRDLGELFDAAAARDTDRLITRLNALLRAHPVSPYVSGHDGASWHLHVAEHESSVADTLAAETLTGMAILVCDLGADRLGRCGADGCIDAFVDLSPNRSRRYCSDRCSSRANVAAFRARRKAATPDGPTPATSATTCATFASPATSATTSDPPAPAKEPLP